MSEPAHDWCYYFTKAELAYQMGDFEKVIELGEAALATGKSTGDPNEWLIFIEAHAMAGDFQTAEKLSELMLSEGHDARIARGLCVIWKRMQTQSPAGSEDRVREVLSQFGCDS
jgi:pentatricopeptide repeat protein